MKVETLIKKRGDKEECVFCGEIENLTVDHVTPQVLGVRNGLDWENLQILCKRCNSVKGGTTMSELKRYISRVYKKVGGKGYSFCPFCGEEL